MGTCALPKVLAMLSLPSRPCGLHSRGYVFECELLIPDLDNVMMHGDTVVISTRLDINELKRKREIAAGKDDAKSSVR